MQLLAVQVTTPPTKGVAHTNQRQQLQSHTYIYIYVYTYIYLSYLRVLDDYPLKAPNLVLLEKMEVLHLPPAPKQKQSTMIRKCYPTSSGFSFGGGVLLGPPPAFRAAGAACTAAGDGPAATNAFDLAARTRKAASNPSQDLAGSVLGGSGLSKEGTPKEAKQTNKHQPNKRKQIDNKQAKQTKPNQIKQGTKLFV